jgi:hypothetical protein
MPRPAIHPNVVDLDMKIGQDAAEALKPAAQASLCVGVGNAVMNMRRDCFYRLPSDGC